MTKEEIAVRFVTELIRSGVLRLPKSVVSTYHEILEDLSEEENSDEEECEKLLKDAELVWVSTGERGSIVAAWHSPTNNETMYEVVWEDPEDVELFTHSEITDSADIRVV